jgi:hypothetical protein
MAAIRATLHSNLHCILSADMTHEYIDFISVLKVIALTSMPLPRTTDASYTSPVPSRHRQREPDSAALQKLDCTDQVLKKPRVERLHSIVFPLVYAEVPVPLRKASIDLRSPEPTSTHAARTGGEPNTSDDSEPESNLKFFSTVSLNAISTTAPKFIMDSGAGKCGTSDLTLLSHVQPCTDITVSGAFGPSTVPTHAGKFGPLHLDAVHIKGMGSQTLVSLSQFCAGGTSGQKFIGVFTPTEYRMYDMKTALPAIAELAKHGHEAERGTVQNGIYVRESS